MQNSAHRKLFNLKLYYNLFRLYFHQKLDKCFENIKNIKMSRFEGNWNELREKIQLYRQSDDILGKKQLRNRIK